MSVRYWIENFKRTVRDVGDRQVIAGMAAMLIGAFGYSQPYDRPDIQSFASIVGTVYIAMLLLFVTPQRMWDESQAVIKVHEERLKPRLSFVFEPAALPYFQVFEVRDDAGRTVPIRIQRVGIRN